MLEVLIRGNTGLAHKENWTCWDSNHRPLNPWIVVCDHYTTCPHSYPAALRFYYDTRAVEVHPAARIILQQEPRALLFIRFNPLQYASSQVKGEREEKNKKKGKRSESGLDYNREAFKIPRVLFGPLIPSNRCSLANERGRWKSSGV